MLHNKRVTILGGSRGIGLAVAHAAVRDGDQVIIASSRRENVTSAAQGFSNGAATGAVVGLRSGESIAEFLAKLGAFDHLVFTAGEPLPPGTPVAETDLVRARGLFESRYWGAVAAVKAARAHMRDGGSIVLTNGTSARRRPASFAFAASTCGAIEPLTRALARAL